MSTVHWWARHEILVPSVSWERVKLWSYADLMGLRIIHWMRRAKTTENGTAVPRTAMPAVRRALAQLDELDLGLWSEETGPTVAIDLGGSVVVLSRPESEGAYRQRLLEPGPDALLRVFDPFVTAAGVRGPDLYAPRPSLRIVLGKLGGSPHISHTRLDLERQLARNLRAA